jgi:hypothetical protein
VVGLLVPLGEAFGVDDVVRGQHLGPLGVVLLLVLELVGARGVGDVQHALRVGHLGGALALGAVPGGAVVLAEEFGGLVEQRHVGHGPGTGHRAAHGGGVRVVEVPLGGGEEVGHQPLRAEHRPQLVDGRPDRRVLGEFVADLGEVARIEQAGAVVGVGADPLGVQLGEGVEDVALEVLARHVVGQPGGAGAFAGDVDQAVVEHQDLAVVLDGEDRVGQGLAVADDGGEDVGHRGAALHGGRLRGVDRRRAHPRVQLADGREEHAGLAEGGQHLADVAEEGGVGPDDEHGPPGEQLAVLVEEVGGPVQGDGGLAGARAALDDEHAPVRRPDDLVLLGLDGLHDVAHPAGARGVERGEQHRVAGRVLVAGAGGVAEVEDLVVQGGDPAALGTDVPAAAQAERGVPGGQVEGAGDVGAPVDEDRGAVGVVGAQPDAADVVGGARRQVDPAEAQRAVDSVQRGQQPGALGDQDVPFEAGLHGGVAPGERVRDPGLGVPAQGVHARVQVVDEFLLVPHFTVWKFGV